jgi:hypothetical protein
MRVAWSATPAAPDFCRFFRACLRRLVRTRSEFRRQRVEGNPNLPGTKSKLFRKEIQGKPEGNSSICLPLIEPFQ